MKLFESRGGLARRGQGGVGFEEELADLTRAQALGEIPGVTTCYPGLSLPQVSAQTLHTVWFGTRGQRRPTGSPQVVAKRV